MSAIKFEGLEDCIEAIEDLASVAEYRKKLVDACGIVLADAVAKAPKGNGELRRSLKYKIDDSGEDLNGVVYSTLLYAPYVEFGTGLFAANGDGRKDVPWHYKDEKGNWHTTSGMPPQPYLYPAMTENREKIIEIFRGKTND